MSLCFPQGEELLFIVTLMATAERKCTFMHQTTNRASTVSQAFMGLPYDTVFEVIPSVDQVFICCLTQPPSQFQSQNTELVISYSLAMVNS